MYNVIFISSNFETVHLHWPIVKYFFPLNKLKEVFDSLRYGIDSRIGHFLSSSTGIQILDSLCNPTVPDIQDYR